MSIANPPRHFAWPAYLVSATLILIPVFDSLMTLYPWRLGEARWRFGAVGLLSNALLLPLAGVLLAFLTSWWLQHGTTRRIIAIASLVAAAVCVAVVGLFTLDALQTRATVAATMHLSFDVASITAAVKTLLAATTLFAVGISARRGPSRGTQDDPARSLIGAIAVPKT